jgi:hypothetical protein
MPVVLCPHCHLRLYVPATHATLLACLGCGRPFTFQRADLIGPVVTTERELRSGRRRWGGRERP